MHCCRSCWCNCKDLYGVLLTPVIYAQIGFVIYCTIVGCIFPLYGSSLTGFLLTAIFLFLVVMVLWSGLRSTFTEPGFVVDPIKVGEETKKIYVEEQARGFCQKCDCMKPARAYHCRRCGKCILKMDHHCPWINNCVGARNQKFFILYLIYVFFGEVLAVILGCCRIYQARYDIYENSELVYFADVYPLNQYLPKWFSHHIFLPVFDSDILPEVLIILEVFFSLLFAIFVLILLYNQYTTIRYDCTYVEYLKSMHVNTMENSFFDCLVSTMGEPPCWRWFVPLEGKYMPAILSRLSKEFVNLPYVEVPLNNQGERYELSLEEKKVQ